jgi:hypothetical protein
MMAMTALRSAPYRQQLLPLQSLLPLALSLQPALQEPPLKLPSDVSARRA